MVFRRIRLFSLLAIIFLAACGGGGAGAPSDGDIDSNSTNPDFVPDGQEPETDSPDPVESVSFEVPVGVPVSLEFGLLQQISDSPQDFVASTAFTSVGIDAGSNASGEVPATGIGNVVIVSNSSDEPILIHYVEAPVSGDGVVVLDAISMAKGLLAINPLVAAFEKETREELLNSAPILARFDDLVLRISESARRKRTDFLAEDDPLGLLRISSELVGELLGDSDSPDAKASAAGKQFGDMTAPHLVDEVGESVLFVNPTLAFYGVSINDSEIYMLNGKEKIWSFIDGTGATDNVTLRKFLNNGNSRISFTLGKDSLDPAALLAMSANAMRLFCYIADFLWACPLDNNQIGLLAEKLEASGDSELSDILDGLLLAGVVEGGTEILGYLGKLTGTNATETNFNRIYKFMSGGLDQRTGLSRPFVAGSKQLIASINRVLGFLRTVNTTQRYAPFLAHYAFKPGRLNFCINNLAGDISNECVEESRTPRPAIRVDNSTPNLNEEIVFSVTDLNVVEVGPAELVEYRWDIENDGVIEQDWQVGAESISYSFGGPGVYSARVDARNRYGATAADALSVEVLHPRSRAVSMNHPEAGGRQVFITNVEMNLRKTELTFTVRASSRLCWNKQGENSPYLIVDGVKHSLTDTENVTFCDSTFAYSRGSEFTLIFDPIPLTTTQFNLIEGEAAERGEERYFNYYGVSVPLASKQY